MKRLLIVFAAALAAATAAALAGDNNGHASIGQPGYYGRLDLGGYPQPQVIYRHPIAIERVPMNHPPVYLRVPPGQAKNWRKHCHEYHACGERVFFVQDKWYNREYVPRYQEHHRDHRDDPGNEHRDNRGDEHSDDHHGSQNDYRGDDHDDGHDH